MGNLEEIRAGCKPESERLKMSISFAKWYYSLVRLNGMQHQYLGAKHQNIAFDLHQRLELPFA